MIQRRTFVAQAASLTTVWGLSSGPATAQTAPVSAVVIWNRLVLAAIAATRFQAPMAARAISMVNEAIYNAWCCYDGVAAFTVNGLSRRPAGERSNGTKSLAVAHASYAVLVDLFPSEKARFDAQLAATPAAGTVPGGTAAVAMGQQAAAALLAARRYDGSNQYGDLAPGAYADYTGYQSVNTPDLLVDPTRWQPLRLVDASGATIVQRYLTPHWGRVRPFAIQNPAWYRPSFFPRAPLATELSDILAKSAQLTDTTKALVDFWAANPGTVSPPGQWVQIAEQVSINDRNTLDRDVKLFFGTGQAVLDASIAAWDTKLAYDSVRPITAIRYYFRNQMVLAWGGPGKGAQYILGQNWHPYQRTTSPTPPFPEFVSGHSTFSAAAAFVIAGIRASDGITLTGTIKARAIGVEGNTTPVNDVTFTWTSLPQAADSAGISRIWGGIHFTRANENGGQLGRSVGGTVLARVRALFEGRNVF